MDRSTDEFDVRQRALRSAGTSADAIYRMVRRALVARGARGSLLDVGCGAGQLHPYIGDLVESYTGVDVVRYDSYPEGLDFHLVDLDTGTVPLADGAADVVVAVETIEHLENPRAFARELARLTKPGGWMMISTPNQRSFLSLLALVLKGHFVAFQESCYPAHITALVETDLRRIAGELGLEEIAIEYTRRGRMPLSGRNFPAWVSRIAPRLFSDNLLLAARKPIGASPGGS